MALDMDEIKKTGGKRGKGAKAAKPEGEATLTNAEKRVQRRQRLAEANTVTVVLDTEVRKFIAAQAKTEGMDMAPFMQVLAENYVLATAPADQPLARRITAKRAIMARTLEIAKTLDQSGGFDEHFVLNVVREAAADPAFMEHYHAAVDADTADERALARAQAPVHQQMGRLIKRAAGARSKRGDKGKIQRAQVQGELISSYTLLEKAGKKA